MNERQQVQPTRGEIIDQMYRLRLIISVIAALAALNGCGSRVTMLDPTIPEPLIDKMKIRVVGRYPDDFKHFVHEERVVGKEKWTIDLGASNSLLFTQLFSAMFSDYQVIDAEVDPRDLEIDALIEPTIDAFEFSVPNQSQTEEFAVWIRYRIKIYDSTGTQVANWPISAYGKSQTTTFGGDDALRRAAVLAMRDAAALMILQMEKATGISALSAARQQSEQDPADTMTETPVRDIVQTTAAEDSPDDAG